MTKILYSILFLTSSFCCYAQDMHKPKLIVQIVVDQLRGDLITEFQSQFGSSGFNYLLNHAINYQNAHHPHANTTTCVGHATIATGSFPSLHGIIDNDWYDIRSKKLTYCARDLKAKVLPTLHTKIEIEGRSPKYLNGSTISDEINLANKGKVFAVSLKDRAAIMLAGHTGKAFWFDKTNGGFVTSNYYYAEYPEWVRHWNKHYLPKSYDWNLSHPVSYYQNTNIKPLKNNNDFGIDFPHHVVNPPSEEYFKSLKRTPKADQLTADFAEQLLINEHLGKSINQTDYLAVSFSATDAIGHQFGPHSLEAEDNLIQLDETLAHFFSILDKEVGLDNILIVFTADHGVGESSSFLKKHHIKEAKLINTGRLQQYISTLLSKRYQLPAKTLVAINLPFIYLDHPIINEHHLDVANVSQFIAEAIKQEPGIFRAYALPITSIEKDWLTTKVDSMSYPLRSGDIYVVAAPYQSHNEKQEDTVAHGSPWQYDSYVPLLFVHSNFKPQAITRRVYTTDIASTLSALLVIKPPSGAVGRPLKEVLNKFNAIKQ